MLKAYVDWNYIRIKVLELVRKLTDPLHRKSSPRYKCLKNVSYFF
jgi:hypothetical protein